MVNKNNSSDKREKKSIRTDLAIEARELAGDIKQELEGIEIETNEYLDDRMKVTNVKILDERGQAQLNKPVGNYVTVECDDFKLYDLDIKEEMIKIIGEELKKIIGDEEQSVLIVGLGNHNITPDSLGPKVVEKLIVTRHLFSEIEDFDSDQLERVSALAPGVMGQTGMETVEIIKGVVDVIKPDLVIAIDALASRKTSRVNTTIQISDTGVHPGSGVGNKRKGLTEETLGVKVIGLGVPTVVDAATIVYDTMDELMNRIRNQLEDESVLLNDIENLQSNNKYGLIKEVMLDEVGDMFVTPKEIDEVIEKISDIVSIALNISVHRDMDYETVENWLS